MGMQLGVRSPSAKLRTAFTASVIGTVICRVTQTPSNVATTAAMTMKATIVPHDPE